MMSGVNEGSHISKTLRFHLSLISLIMHFNCLRAAQVTAFGSILSQHLQSFKPIQRLRTSYVTVHGPRLTPPVSQLRNVTRGGFLMQAFTLGAALGLKRNPASAKSTSSITDNDLPIVAYKTKSGVRYYDVREGEGPTPDWGQMTIIHYEGFIRATPDSRLVLFDDTYNRRTPYLIKHGNGRVIRGLDEGMHTMKLGGLRRIVIPLSLGYIKTGLGPLPPNTFRRRILIRELGKAEAASPPGEIVYDVELLSVYDDEADLGYYRDETFDNEMLQKGLNDALNELRTKGIKVPSAKSFNTKPQVLGGQKADVDQKQTTGSI